MKKLLIKVVCAVILLLSSPLMASMVTLLGDLGDVEAGTQRVILHSHLSPENAYREKRISAFYADNFPEKLQDFNPNLENACLDSRNVILKVTANFEENKSLDILYYMNAFHYQCALKEMYINEVLIINAASPEFL